MKGFDSYWLVQVVPCKQIYIYFLSLWFLWCKMNGIIWGGTRSMHSTEHTNKQQNLIIYANILWVLPIFHYMFRFSRKKQTYFAWSVTVWFFALSLSFLLFIRSCCGGLVWSRYWRGSIFPCIVYKIYDTDCNAPRISMLGSNRKFSKGRPLLEYIAGKWND